MSTPAGPRASPRKASFSAAVITLHNSSKATHNFNLDPTPLVGPEAAAATVLLTPNSVQLSAGAYGVVRVKLQKLTADGGRRQRRR